MFLKTILLGVVFSWTFRENMVLYFSKIPSKHWRHTVRNSDMRTFNEILIVLRDFKTYSRESKNIFQIYWKSVEDISHLRSWVFHLPRIQAYTDIKRIQVRCCSWRWNDILSDSSYIHQCLHEWTIEVVSISQLCIFLSDLEISKNVFFLNEMYRLKAFNKWFNKFNKWSDWTISPPLNDTCMEEFLRHALNSSLPKRMKSSIVTSDRISR